MIFEWNENNDQVWQQLKNVVSHIIQRIELVIYELNDKPEWPGSQFLQIWFTDGLVIFLDSDSTGETLRVSVSPWIDPFADKLDATNAEYIRRHGKWTLFDVSQRPPFDTLIGHAVDALYPIFNKFGVFNGVQFVINGQELSIVVEADECDLFWGKDNPVLVQKGHVVIR